ncbi:MAG TPA: hypothetical protein V6D50_22635 [Chroococcales cyanobacterium]
MQPSRARTPGSMKKYEVIRQILLAKLCPSGGSHPALPTDGIEVRLSRSIRADYTATD